jgi:hypothetical protein
MRIDEWMPSYDFVERHTTYVRAPPPTVYQALLDVDLGRLFVVRLLLGLRALAALLGSSRRSLRGLGDGTLRTFLGRRFTVLVEDPPTEIVLGITGRFWMPSGSLVPTEAESFRDPPPAGTARAAWNFHLSADSPALARLTTETRIRCADAAARRSFRVYWRVVRPGSGLIRRAILNAVRREAERRAAGRS